MSPEMFFLIRALIAHVAFALWIFDLVAANTETSGPIRFDGSPQAYRDPQTLLPATRRHLRGRIHRRDFNGALALLLLVALLAGCATTSRLYQPFLSSGASEECRSLESVITDRKAFGIVAASENADEDALRRCILEDNGGAGGLPTPPTQAEASEDCRVYRAVVDGRQSSEESLPELARRCRESLSRYRVKPEASAHGPEASSHEVQLEPYNGVFAVPVVVNRSIRIPFVLDSGAAEVQLPAEVVLTLIRTGTLSESDFIGRSSYVLANGSTFRSARFNIREMRVGENVVRNVAASIGPAVSSDALLGQSFLSKLPSWTLDNKRHMLILAR